MTQAAQLAQYGANNVGLSFKNRIINGDMSIDQRNAGAAVTINDTAAYTVDRWFGEDVTDGAFTVQQISDAPVGFSNSARITITTADASLAAGQYAVFVQRIEGFNTADLGWGTANAATVTLSFWTKSSLTGTFGGVVSNGAENYSYPFTYTISAANTWEYKTITIVGPTAGTWVGSTNGKGLVLGFSLGSGSTYTGTAGAWVAADDRGGATGQTNIISTLSATWQVTGVQLEKGTVATSFDYLPYTTELQLCQRYFQTYRGADNPVCVGVMNSSTNFIGVVTYVVEMRATPTLSATSGSSFFRVFTTTGSNPSTVFANDLQGSKAMSFNATTPDSLTAGQAGYFRCFNASAQINYSAEL
jgi:hypothetical protein